MTYSAELTIQHAGEASPFLQNQRISLAILPTVDVLSLRDVINYAKHARSRPNYRSIQSTAGARAHENRSQ